MKFFLSLKINSHLTKTTTWDDPRRLYNLPSNQNEISHDLRVKISKTIALPSNWEEATSANGEIYYINHSNRTTSWEDPRICNLIYMICLLIYYEDVLNSD